jgi:uncharacterized protein YjiS (DUF1127 family)
VRHIFALHETFNIFDNVSPAIYAGIKKIENLFATINQWRVNHKSRQYLATLDNRLLRDIGLNRTDVENELNKPFWR